MAMNVKDMQITQRILFNVGVRSGSDNENKITENNPSLSDISLTNGEKTKLPDKNNGIDIYYPPLFPLGHTQGIYDIGKSENSSVESTRVPEAADRNENNKNTEVVAGKNQIVSNEKGLMNNNSTADNVSMGGFLDLEI